VDNDGGAGRRDNARASRSPTATCTSPRAGFGRRSICSKARRRSLGATFARPSAPRPARAIPRPYRPLVTSTRGRFFGQRVDNNQREVISV